MATILLVEDNPSITITLSGLLEADGHKVIACGDPATAVELVYGDAPMEVAFIDYWLANETAEPVLASLRKKRPTTPVILITGGSKNASVETTRWLGALDGIDGFLQKPFLRRDIQAVLRKLGL